MTVLGKHRADSPGAQRGRPYGGVSAEVRSTLRRERLIDAALDLIGVRGYAATTVDDICGRAKLTKRYFYEQFDGREQILGAVYEHVIGRVTSAVETALAAAPANAAAQTRAGLNAFVSTLAENRRMARVQLLEVVGVSADLELRRREVMRAFADLIASRANDLSPSAARTESDTKLTAMFVIGGVSELLTDWISGRLEVTPQQLVDHCVAACLALDGIGS